MQDPYNKKANFHRCPLCEEYLSYLSRDIRPVFPEERLFFELITGTPNRFTEESVWCNNSTYFVDGESYKITSGMWYSIDPNVLRDKIHENSTRNSYDFFNLYIKNFIMANKNHLNYIRFEAMEFTREVVSKYPDMPKYVSFSGGKDSTITSDLVIKALADTSVPNIFCDTTLEYPYTLEYIKRLKEKNPKYIIKTIKNKEHNFYKLCKDIGVPSVSKRWCCTIFKSGISSKFLNQFFIGERVVTFSGLRSSESNVRRGYKRIDGDNEKRKIQNQIMISPIFHWKDVDVWLYILSQDIDFNDAYRLGFSRAGCWCCPNTSYRGDILAKIYMKKEAEKWYKFLVKYAEDIGKENPKNYIDKGK